MVEAYRFEWFVVLAGMVLMIVGVILSVRWDMKRKKKRAAGAAPGTGAKQTIFQVEMDIFLCRQFLVDNAERVLNGGGEFHPMGIALLRSGKTDYFNWQNWQVTTAELDKWLAQRAADTVYSLSATDDPEQSRLKLTGSLRGNPEPEIEMVGYADDGGKRMINMNR